MTRAAVTTVVSWIGLLVVAVSALAEEPSAAAGDDVAIEAELELVRRDPFRPFTLDVRPEEEAEPLTPLRRYELRQLTVTGIIWNLQIPVAMVEDDARMGFIVSPGTLIGRQHGVVKTIEPGRIMVEEKVSDAYGQLQTQQVAMEMSKDRDAHGGEPERP